MSSPDSEIPEGPETASHLWGRRIEELRRKSLDFSDERRETWSDLEQRLVGELNSLVSRLDAWEDYQAALSEEAGRLRHDQEALSRESDLLQSRTAELDDQQQHFAERRKRIARKLALRRTALSRARNAECQEVEQRLEQLHSEIESLREKTVHLQEERDRAQEERDRAQEERDRAQEERDRAQEERDRAQEERDRAQGKLDRAQEECGRLYEQQQQLATQQDGREQDFLAAQRALQAAQEAERTMRQQVAQSRKLLNERGAHIKKLREQVDAAQRQLQEAEEAARKSAAGELARWQEERGRLQAENGVLRMECQRLEAAAAGQLAAGESGAAVEGGPTVEGETQLNAERQRLVQLQEEWREKIRVAEVELAVQRAENGRMRASLENKMRELEQQANMLAKLEKKTGSGRRWMDHLGLSDPNK